MDGFRRKIKLTAHAHISLHFGGRCLSVGVRRPYRFTARNKSFEVTPYAFPQIMFLSLWRIVLRVRDIHLIYSQICFFCIPASAFQCGWKIASPKTLDVLCKCSHHEDVAHCVTVPNEYQSILEASQQWIGKLILLSMLRIQNVPDACLLWQINPWNSTEELTIV